MGIMRIIYLACQCDSHSNNLQNYPACLQSFGACMSALRSFYSSCMKFCAAPYGNNSQLHCSLLQIA